MVAEGRRTHMRKILLDLYPVKSVEMTHQYLKFELDLGEYYGNNLDALYDELTSITEDTCIGLFYPCEEDGPLAAYQKKLVKVFKDAEAENGHLAVIFGDMEQNYEAD